MEQQQEGGGQPQQEQQQQQEDEQDPQQQQQQEEQEQEEEAEEEESINAFDQELTWLRDQEYDTFQFRDAMIHNGDRGDPPPCRWTMEQARDVFDALMASEVIETLFVELELCQPQAVGLFVEYIRSSESVTDLTVAYDRSFFNERTGDPVELQQSYMSQIDNIFRAVLKNPTIETLGTKWLASPESIYELLSKTTSLKNFELATGETNQGHDQNYVTAFHVAAGFSQNASLKRVKLHATNVCGNLGVIVSGLDRHPCLEQLTVWYTRPDVDLFVAMAKLLHFTPTLKKLEVREEDSSDLADFSCDVNFDRVMFSLCCCCCAGLKELTLVDVVLGLGWKDLVQGGDEDASSASAATSSEDTNNNTVLEELTLDRVVFMGRNAVPILWRLVGIRVLSIKGIRYEDSPEEEEDETGNDEGSSSVWKKLIEQNKKLESVSLDHVHVACFNGVLEGARSHETLESLSYVDGEDFDTTTGTLLRRVLQNSKTLKKLSLIQSPIRRSGVDQLAQGLCDSMSLVSLDLDLSIMRQTPATTIIGSLLVNKTLEYLRFGYSGTAIMYNGPFGRALLAVVRVNTSLLHLHLPRVDLRGTAIAELLGGFGDENRLKTLDLSKCAMDNAGLVALGRALVERENIVVDSIELPHVHGDSTGALRAFIGSLRLVPRRFKVIFLNNMDQELLELLLSAAQENKNLLNFGTLDLISDNSQVTDSDLPARVDFHLKLNRFGLGLFASQNPVPTSLWPRIFESMAKSLDDSDALFYIMREYFMSSTNRGQGPVQQEPGQAARPTKRARTIGMGP